MGIICNNILPKLLYIKYNMLKITNKSNDISLDSLISVLKRRKDEKGEIKEIPVNNQIIKNDDKQIPFRVVGETKHYNPASKQWRNSVYAYNKNYLKTLPAKDSMTNKIIKNYFYLADCKKLARSRRMRSLIRKSRTEKLYTSKPEIKQTSDKVIVTIYTFDRERQLLLRKIYFDIRKLEKTKKRKNRKPVVRLFNSYENWRNRYSLQKSFFKLRAKTYLLSINNLNSRKLKRKYLLLSRKYLLLKNSKNKKSRNYFYIKNSSRYTDRNYFIKTKLSLKLFKRRRKKMFQKTKKKERIKRHIPYMGLKSVNQLQFLLYRQQLKRKNIKIQKLLFYGYMKHILHKFGIKILSRKDISKAEIISNPRDDKVFFSMPGNSIKVFDMGHNTPRHYTYLDKVNLLVSSVLKRILSSYHIPAEKLHSFYSIFSKRSFRSFLSDKYKPGFFRDKVSNKPKKLKIRLNKKQLVIVKREAILINRYLNLKINYLKFSNYLPALKLLISKIYNKSTELNIVNLKYPHLDTDIFTQAIATKMKKKLSLLKVMRRSLKLIKMPYAFTERTNRYNLNNIKMLNTHRSLLLTDLKTDSQFITTNVINHSDQLQFVLDKLYPRSLISGINDSSDRLKATIIDKNSDTENKLKRKIVNVLNSIKYKWVTGARLESAGRLTRRYTASRSVYKYRFKGSLRDTDFSRKLDFIKKSMPVVMSRNLVKSNSQYSFAKSKRRIGAFGIKGWISSY